MALHLNTTCLVAVTGHVFCDVFHYDPVRRSQLDASRKERRGPPPEVTSGNACCYQSMIRLQSTMQPVQYIQ